MPPHESPFRSLHPRLLPCRLRNLSTVSFAALASLLASSAWLALLLSPLNPLCWSPWPCSPLAFLWDDSTASLRPPEPHLIRNATSAPLQPSSQLSLRNIAFGIAGSARLWPHRKEYVKLWWRPDEMLGFVWLEENVRISKDDADLLPQVLVSEDTSGFRYTHSTGHPSGVRIARIIREIFQLHLTNVCWFVLGDDDTIFSPDNLLRVLKKYDHNEMYYIGSPSETHSANTYFSHGMAFGGGGIALSYPLAETLSVMLDDCLERYPSLFGSDDRLHACITEIGVPLTREPGFHQFDIRGNAFGFLASHPISPFISMHHLDEMDPVFPNLDSLGAMKNLVNALHTEPSSFLQQCICYDRRQKFSISVSLGYVVQVFPGVVLPPELQKHEITFKAWNSKVKRGDFDMDTRKPLRSYCRKPFVFFMEDINKTENGIIVSTYKRDGIIDELKRRSFCFSRVLSPGQVERVRVSSRPLNDHWFLVPRRQCCKLMGIKDKVLSITVSACQHWA